jgi:tetratricopeptide (TPR) repeat protein
MRHKPEMLLIGAMSVFALTGVGAMALQEAGRPARVAQPQVLTTRIVDDAGDADAWFGAVRPFCNPVEVDARLSALPVPPTPEGAMRQAACYALAGRIDQAGAVIDALPERLRPRAAGYVFDAGHPAADAGDDVAAGPLMELVLKYWPTNYMALYHAGKARYERGDYAVARGYLERFLAEYASQDGWHASAVSMLETIEKHGR